ncbi:Elongation factor 2 [Mortierella sp. NVP85]|nr:Elongation factor 2 [Mortierella sp. NVP85]
MERGDTDGKAIDNSLPKKHPILPPFLLLQEAEFLINLTDPSGHADLPETNTSLDASDGALVVVDCIEGVNTQTETVLRQALKDRMRPVLFINRIDHAMIVSMLMKEDLYQRFQQIIDQVNAIISTCKDDALGDVQVSAPKGSVAFGSGLDGWAFTVPQFAEKYALKFGVDVEDIAEKMWGDSYFGPVSKRWSKEATDYAGGKPLERAFNMLILDPIFKVFDAALNKSLDEVLVLGGKLDVTSASPEKEQEKRQLLRIFMRQFLPAEAGLLAMMATHLPSPVTARGYRAKFLYESPLDDRCADSIRTTDPEGSPLDNVVPTDTTDKNTDTHASNTENVRNVCVIGPPGHGKTALTTTLHTIAGIHPDSHENASNSSIEHIKDQACATMTRPSTFSLRLKRPEKDPGYAEQGANGAEFLINLTDPPTQGDLLSETNAFLHANDGVLVVVDCVEGVNAQAEAVLRQALMARMKPVLFINRVDRAMTVYMLKREDVYQCFRWIIDQVNTIISSCKDDALGDVQVSVRKGTVVFGSGLDGWAFTVPQFAEKYAQKFKVDAKKLTDRFWGDRYLEPVSKLWNRTGINSENGKPLERSFNMFVLHPIYQLFDCVLNKTMDNVTILLKKVGVPLTPSEMELERRQLLKVVMKEFLPAEAALLEMMATHLPSPAAAQKYRAGFLYEGPFDDQSADIIRTSDPEGSLLNNVSMIAPTDKDMTSDLRALMRNVKNVRNICIIGSQGHGKSALTRTLYTAIGITPTSHKSASTSSTAEDNDASTSSATEGNDTSTSSTTEGNGARTSSTAEGNDEELVPTSITKPTTFMLYLKKPGKNQGDNEQETSGDEFLINLMDPPGHTDLLSESNAFLHTSDGALVVVDCVEGVGIQAEAVLRQALADRIKPVLFINRIDRAMTVYMLKKEDLYQCFQRIIDQVNAIISTYKDDTFGDVQVSVQKGTVAFGSGLDGWAFALPQFAEKYAQKFGVHPEVFGAKLWGNHHYGPVSRKWSNDGIDAANGQPIERGFNMFILDPIFKIFDTALNKTLDDVLVITEKLGIQLTSSEKEQENRQLLKTLMKRFLPAETAFSELMLTHLPSPVEAQKYRTDVLYEGSLNDPHADSIRACDPNGPLVVYVSKMVPTYAKGHYFAFARVFSGTLRKGQTIYLHDPNYGAWHTKELVVKSLGEMVQMSGLYTHMVKSCPAGNIIGLTKVDKFVLRTCTLTATKEVHKIRTIRMSSPPIVEMAVEIRNARDLPKLVEGIQNLSKSNISAHCYTADTGEHIIAGTSESQVKAYADELEQVHAQVPLRRREPYSRYRETITSESHITVLAKSPNKHSRYYLRAAPLGEELTLAIEKGIVKTHDFKARVKVLTNEYGWDNGEARRIWSFGPHGTGPNILVDQTHGVQYLNEVRDSCAAGFSWSTRESVYAEEELRGCRFNIMDVVMTGSAIHRGGGQVIPAVRCAVYSSVMVSEPRFMEPVYLADVKFPAESRDKAEQVLQSHRGQIIAEESWPGLRQRYSRFKAYIPVPEALGLSEDFWKVGLNPASATLVFDHWEKVPFEMEDPKGQELIMKIRLRKGLRMEMPKLENYLDRL